MSTYYPEVNGIPSPLALAPTANWADGVPPEMVPLGPDVIAMLQRLGWRPEYGLATLEPGILKGSFDWTWPGKAELDNEEDMRIAIACGYEQIGPGQFIRHKYEGPIPEYLLAPTAAGNS